MVPAGEVERENMIPLMAHVSAIYVKDFEMKLYSDNGKISTGEDNDLVYMSDTAEDYVHEHEEITMRINSALTTDERRELGVEEDVSLSIPLDARTGRGLTEITAHTQAGKPEQLYVDAYYGELSAPRVELTQQMRMSEGDPEWGRYTHPALPGRTFRALGVDRNLMEDYVELKLREQ